MVGVGVSVGVGPSVGVRSPAAMNGCSPNHGVSNSMGRLVGPLRLTIGFHVTIADALVSPRNAVAISESLVLIMRTFLIWSRRPFILIARSKRYSLTVFSTSRTSGC